MPVEADNPFFLELINLHFAWPYQTPSTFFFTHWKALYKGEKMMKTLILPWIKVCCNLSFSVLCFGKWSGCTLVPPFETVGKRRLKKWPSAQHWKSEMAVCILKLFRRRSRFFSTEENVFFDWKDLRQRKRYDLSQHWVCIPRWRVLRA